jgi:hypothetical protein
MPQGCPDENPGILAKIPGVVIQIKLRPLTASLRDLWIKTRVGKGNATLWVQTHKLRLSSITKYLCVFHYTNQAYLLEYYNVL